LLLRTLRLLLLSLWNSLLLWLLSRSLLRLLLLLRSLLLRLLGPLLRLLRLFLRVLLFLVLRVHRDQRPEKQKQGSRAIDSNELHGVIVSLT
jgi:hypothetical protein